MQLKDRHVLVTGGTRRVGKALVDALLDEGARVTAHYFRTPPQAEHPRLKAVQADLREQNQLLALASQARRNHGPISALINSASDFYPTPAGTCSEEAWEDLFSLNLKAPFFLTAAVQEDLKVQKGCLINICDILSEYPLPRFGPYCATKAGLKSLTRSFAADWAPLARACSISPGAILLPDNFTEEQKQKASQWSLFKRVGSPGDIAAAVLFILQNDYVNGIDLVVDGGASLQ